MKNLLIETNLFEGKINEDASGRTLVKGVLQRAIAENQNGRVYPKEILMREAKKYETLIKECLFLFIRHIRNRFTSLF